MLCYSKKEEPRHRSNQLKQKQSPMMQITSVSNIWGSHVISQAPVCLGSFTPLSLLSTTYIVYFVGSIPLHFISVAAYGGHLMILACSVCRCLHYNQGCTFTHGLLTSLMQAQLCYTIPCFSFPQQLLQSWNFYVTEDEPSSMAPHQRSALLHVPFSSAVFVPLKPVQICSALSTQ